MHFRMQGWKERLIFIYRLALYDLGSCHVAERIVNHVRLVEGWSMARSSRGKGSWTCV